MSLIIERRQSKKSVGWYKCDQCGLMNVAPYSTEIMEFPSRPEWLHIPLGYLKSRDLCARCTRKILPVLRGLMADT